MFRRKLPIAFLHIGKNAGTEIADRMTMLNKSGEISFEKMDHSVRLRNLAPRQQYFFSIRDPVTRFVSGFYSRKRMGRPRLDLPWSRHESLSFRDFDHANDLAESLFRDCSVGRDASAAMNSIFHINAFQADWFQGKGHFLELRPPIWIIRVEHLEEDLRAFADRLGVSLGDQNGRLHHNDYSNTPPLSRLAKSNLLRWYQRDVEFYRQCQHWIETSG
jgi:hypothetical protein